MLVQTAITLIGLTTNLAIAAPARTVRVINKCSYDVYPAVAPFPELSEPYTDDRGWRATPNSKRDISIPSAFLGRIWGRHGCAVNGDQVYCVTGGCRDNKLGCADGEMGGGATSVEFRLQTAQNGEYDVYDLSNGAGWGVPVSVTPVGEHCDPISCTPTLSTCPAELQLKDSYGNILGCNSACYGGQGQSDQQCCKGAWSDGSKCLPEMILSYEYFKKPCPHAYAYYQDSRQGSPTVNYLCKAEGEPGFTVTFCPDGDGDSGGLTAGGTATTTSEKGEKSGHASRTTSDSATGKIGQPTGEAASQPPDIPAISSVSLLNVTSINAIEATSQAAATGASSPSAPSSAGPSATEPVGDASDSVASATGTADLPGGISKTTLIGLGVGAVVVAGLGVVVACAISRRKSKSTAAAAPVSTSTRSGPAGGADSDVEAAAASRRTGATNAPTYNALGRSRRHRSRSALLSSSSSSEDLGSLYSDHSAPGSERPRSRSSRRSRR